jgi:hypothetical protein
MVGASHRKTGKAVIFPFMAQTVLLGGTMNQSRTGQLSSLVERDLLVLCSIQVCLAALSIRHIMWTEAAQLLT